MKRFLAGLCAVTLLFVSSTSLKAQENEENAAAEEFKSLIEEIYELRESEKLSRTEWSKIRAALTRLSRKLQDKSAEERAELYNSTGEYLIDLLESAESDEAAETQEEDRQKLKQLEQRAMERELAERERAMAQLAQQRAAELKQHARAVEMQAREVERTVRENAKRQSNLARELAQAKRAAEQEGDDDDDEEGDHGIRMDLDIDGKLIQIDADNLNSAVKELLQELEGVDEVGGRLEALMELNSGKLEEWAEEHSQKWEAWAEDFEKAAENFEHEMEHWAEEEMEEWAREYSQKWEEWAEKLEAQGLEHDDLAELLESNMEMIGELPIKEIYGRAMEKLEDSDLFNEEKMDELGDMIRESVEQALEAIEEDEDVAELLNIAGDKGKNLQETLEKLLQNTDRKKADQMRAAELQALAAERHAEALDRAKAMQAAAQLAAEEASSRASEMRDRLEADRRLAEQDRLEERLNVERAKRADVERLLEERNRLQKRNSEVEELRAQMEALRAELEQLRRNQDRDNDYDDDDDDDDDDKVDNSIVFSQPFLV